MIKQINQTKVKPQQGLLKEEEDLKKYRKLICKKRFLMSETKFDNLIYFIFYILILEK